MRPLDHCDNDELARPYRDCVGCDRCDALELAPREFFACAWCGETLCPTHAHEGDWGAAEDICGACVERRYHRAIDADARRAR